MADIETLTIEMRAATEGAQRKLNAIDNQLGAFQKTALKASTALTNFARGLAVGAVVAFGASIVSAAKKSLDLADSLADVSAITGASTDSLQAWRFAAEQNASSADAFDASLKKLIKNVGEARAGSDTMAESFRRLGMEGVIKSGAKTEEIVNALANALRSIKDPAVAAALATDVLGKQGAELIPVLSQGEAGLKAYGKQLKEAGGHMSRETVKDLAAMADEVKTTTAQFNKMAADIALAGMQSALGVKMMVDKIAIQLQRLAVLYTHGLRGVAEFDNKRIMDQGRANERRHSDAKHGDRTPFVPVVVDESGGGGGGAPKRNEAAEAIKREQAAIKDLLADLDYEYKTMGLTNVELAVQNNLRNLGASATQEQITKVEAWTRRNFEAQEALRKVAEVEAFAADIRAKYGDGTAAVTQQVQFLNDALARGLITAQEYGAALDDALKTDDVREMEEAWDGIKNQAMSGLADTLVEVGANIDSAGEAMARFGEEILKAIAKMLILKAIEAGVNAIFGGPEIAGRASGGPVSAGVPYVVGEHRPELFVPDRNGFIVPSVPQMPDMGAMGGGHGRGGGGMQFHYAPTINAPGADANTLMTMRRMLNEQKSDIFARMPSFIDDKIRRSKAFGTKR